MRTLQNEVTRDYDTLKGAILAMTVGPDASRQLSQALDRIYDAYYQTRESLNRLQKMFLDKEGVPTDNADEFARQASEQ